MSDNGNRNAPDAPERGFDFWPGSWQLSWPAEQTGGEAGTRAGGSNRIERLWDGQVLQENFSTAGGGFQGKSWSVHHAPSGEWRQTWVDNGGGYLLFSGGFTDGVMDLRSAAVEREGKVLPNRMVFRDIASDELHWDWQRSEDGGASWQGIWNSHCRRG